MKNVRIYKIPCKLNFFPFNNLSSVYFTTLFIFMYPFMYGFFIVEQQRLRYCQNMGPKVQLHLSSMAAGEAAVE